MAGERAQKSYLQDLEKIERKIRNIHYIGQHNEAEQYEERFRQIKNNILELLDNPNHKYGLDESDIDFIDRLVALEFDLDEYISGKGEEIKAKQAKEHFEKQMKKIIEEVEKNQTEESYKKLEEAIEEWEKRKHSIIEETEKNEKIAKAVVKILKEQGKKGEEIDISKTEEYCSRAGIIEAVRKELIEIAETKAEEEEIKIKNIAENLDSKTINTEETWKALTNIENIKIAGIEKDQEAILEKIKPQITLLDKALGKTSIYTFGDIDPETGEWKNIKIKYGKYPMKLSKEKTEKLLAIEINDIEKIERIEEYRNVQSIKLGETIKTIEAAAFNGYTHLKKVKLNKELISIGARAFARTGLERIEIPEGVEEIGASAFSGCSSLKEVILGKNLTKIGARVFEGTGLEKIEISDKERNYKTQNFGETDIKKFMDTYFAKEILQNLSLEKITEFLKLGNGISAEAKVIITGEQDMSSTKEDYHIEETIYEKTVDYSKLESSRNEQISTLTVEISEKMEKIRQQEAELEDLKQQLKEINNQKTSKMR